MSLRLPIDPHDTAFPSDDKTAFLPTTAKPPFPPAPPYSSQRRLGPKLRKALVILLSSCALFALFTAVTSHGGGHGKHARGLWGLFDGRYREGWNMVRHGGGRWGDADRHGHDGFFGAHAGRLEVDWLARADDLPTLDLTLPAASSTVGAQPSANVTLSHGTRHVVVALAQEVEAELAVVPAHAAADCGAGLISVELVGAGAGLARESAVRLVDESVNVGKHQVGWAGVVITNSPAQGKYLITLALPPTPAGKGPLDLVLQGDRLAVAKDGLDFDGVRFKRFELRSESGEDAVVKHLNAHEATVHLSTGAIRGSFNVSRELVLRTTVGAIEANVSIFEHHHRHHHDHHDHDRKGNKTAVAVEFEELEQDGDDAELDLLQRGSPSSGEHDGSHPPGPPPPPPSRDRHPKHLVKVLAQTDIGAVALRYVDRSLPAPETSLLSLAKAQVGDVHVHVLPGFKGRFVEAARIGDVGYAAPGGSNVTVEKEVHYGPGGFVKGFVGERPPAPPPHHQHDGEGRQKPCPHAAGEGDGEDAERALYRFRPDEEARERHGHKKDRKARGKVEKQRKHRHHHDENEDEGEDERREHHRHHHHHEAGEFEGEHPPPPPPPHDGPHGPPPSLPHHGPPPPPGYGFAGSFIKTGTVEVVFL